MRQAATRPGSGSLYFVFAFLDEGTVAHFDNTFPLPALGIECAVQVVPPPFCVPRREDQMARNELASTGH